MTAGPASPRRLPAPVLALRDVVDVPELRRVLGAWLAFNAAEWATWVAILVFAYVATGPASVGLVALAQLVPAAVAAPFTARLGDRMPRHRALTLAYLVVGVAMLAAGAAMLLELPVVAVYALAAVVVVSYTSIRPIQSAILPAVVGRAEQLTAANAVSTLLEGAGVLIGPLLCGLIVAAASPAAVFIVSGLATVFSAVLVATLPLGPGHVPVSPVLEPATPAEPPATRSSGIRAVLSDRSRALVVLLLAARFGVAATVDVMLVLAAIDLLGMGQAGAGFLSAAIGVGWVLGGAFALTIAGSRRLSPGLLVGSLIWGLPIGLVAAVAQPGISLLLLVVAGIGLAVVDVAIRTLLQRLVTIDILASVFGVAEGASMAGAAAGALIAAPFVLAFGLRGAIVGTAVLLPLLAVAVLSTVARGEATIRIPFREIAILRRLPLFALVSPPALEAAAAALVPISQPAGTTVIAEGDVGDRFYVVDVGEVVVSQGGREIGRLGPGEAFGELALIRRIPRTATVVAVTNVELLALDRPSFLLAITSSAAALDEADRAAGAFLARDAVAEAQAG